MANIPRYRNDPISVVGTTGSARNRNNGSALTGVAANLIKDATNSSGSSRRDPYEERYGNSGSGTGAITKKPSGSSGGSGGSGGSSYDAAAAAAAAYEAYMAEMRRQQEAAANAAYDRNVAAMNSAFDQRGELLKGNLDTTLQNLQTDYNASRDAINRDATNAAREAYINRMMSQRNLAQNMAAQGLSGGASETTLAGLENNYGNARNQIATTANENLGDLEDLYSKNRNSAMQEYNDQLAADALQRAQYMTQFENDRQNLLAQAYDSQLSQLMSLDPTFVAAMSAARNSQAGYTPAAQAEPSNTPASVSTTQGSGYENGLSNTVRLNYARKVLQNGGDADDIIRGLSQTSSAATIQNILRQLGIA